MARGDIKWFAQALHDLGKKIHDMSGDDFRLGIVTNATVPGTDTVAPHWGGTGTTNFAATEVSTGTGYAGPIVLATERWTLTAGGPRFRVTGDVTITQDADDGFATGYWGIIYNNTDANKRAIAFIDFGGPVGNVSGPIDINWNGVDQDVLSLTQA